MYATIGSMNKNDLRFGIGGVPHTAKGVEKGIQRLHELGLRHMELEFVQSVFVKEEKAPQIKDLAAEQDVTLSVHGSYYTNFASEDKQKWHASINRIVQAAYIGELCGARTVTYHSGFFQKREFGEIKDLVILAMEKVLAELEKKGTTNIKLAPELTGKPAQVGDIDELIEIVKVLQDKGHTQAALCIDFAHKFARDNGANNTYDEFSSLLDKIATGLGSEYLENLHMHVSAIDYSEKGERNHLVMLPSLEAYTEQGVEVEGIESAWEKLPENRFKENTFNWQDLLKALKSAGVGGYLVCESPILELDALLMQKFYHSL